MYEVTAVTAGWMDGWVDIETQHCVISAINALILCIRNNHLGESMV